MKRRAIRRDPKQTRLFRSSGRSEQAHEPAQKLGHPIIQLEDWKGAPNKKNKGKNIFQLTPEFALQPN